jgi:uncharacterized protein
MSPAGNTLPAQIEPILLAEKGAQLVGSLPLKAMARLAEASLDGGGEVQVDLRFGHAEVGKVYEMTGRLRATVHVACQRCLEPMELPLEADVRLLLLRPGERPEGLAPEVEALVVDKPLRLSELVEDELLLAMPMIPMHPADVCPAKDFVKSAAPADKPLSGLSRLKRT